MLAASVSQPPMLPPRYTTHDPYLASFLCFRGASLAGLMRIGPKKVAFQFEANEHLHDLLRLYWSGRLTSLIPSELFATLHRLKCLSIVRQSASHP